MHTFDLSGYVLDAQGYFDSSKLRLLTKRWQALSPNHVVQEIDLCYFGLKNINVGIRVPCDGDGERLSGDLNMLKTPFAYLEECWFELDMQHLPIDSQDFYRELFAPGYNQWT
jgi:hypothetical protein